MSPHRRALQTVTIVACAATFGGQPRASGHVAPVQLAHPFLVAHSGWHGALVPIGRFTGSMWVNTWPPPAASDVAVPAIEMVPLAWLSKPVPRQWTLYLEGRPTRITVTGTRRGDQTGGACTSPAVLTIDKPPIVPETAYDGGLAVDNDQAVEDVHPVERGDATWALLEPVVTATFAAFESRALGEGDQRAFLDALDRRGVRLEDVPVSVEAIYQVITDPSAATYYFTATKRLPGAGGTIGIVVSGWVRRDVGGKWPAMGVTSHTFTSDVVYGRQPLGLLRVLTRRFWVVSVSAANFSAFEIDEATGTDVVRLLETGNGSC